MISRLNYEDLGLLQNIAISQWTKEVVFELKETVRCLEAPTTGIALK